MVSNVKTISQSYPTDPDDMNFRIRRIILSLVISVFCGVFVTSYEYSLPRNPIEDFPQDWLFLSLMVAAELTFVAWLFILLPVSCFLPERSKLLNYRFCIPIGGILGALLTVIDFSLIGFFSAHSADWIDLSPEVVMRILPGAWCGAVCATMYCYLGQARSRPAVKIAD
jgi:hypothetical protein